MGVSCGFQLEQFFSSDFGWGACFQIKLSFIIFVLVNCSSLESVHSECDFNTTVTDLNHQIGQDATMKCKLPVNLTKSKTACREENLKHLKDNMKYDRRLRSLKGDLVLTVYNLTINDSMIYQCGYEGQDLKIQWICCFNLTISEDNSELEDEDEKEEINEGEEETRTTSFIMTTGPTTRDSTIEPLTGELHCALTNQATYQMRCTEANTLEYYHPNLTENCNRTKLTSGKMVKPLLVITFSYKNENCDVICITSDDLCKITLQVYKTDLTLLFVICPIAMFVLSFIFGVSCYLLKLSRKTSTNEHSSTYDSTIYKTPLGEYDEVKMDITSSSTYDSTIYKTPLDEYDEVKMDITSSSTYDSTKYKTPLDEYDEVTMDITSSSTYDSTKYKTPLDEYDEVTMDITSSSTYDSTIYKTH
ncbi:uncharacterized protein [Apostichopus japonicus]|uniref:uncharacterized protein isoform X3 n=1 Tax=Stichopus japonicus TaxID=307972 RepID=UPI003AB4F7C4